MTDRCSILVHPDGFNGEFPRLHEFQGLHEFRTWIACGHPVVVRFVDMPVQPDGVLRMCRRHADVFGRDGGK